MIKRLDLLSLDITLQCNFLCKGCNKFVHPVDSNFYNMSEEEMIAIMTLVAPLTTASYIRVIGGEPLVHPHFTDLARIIQGYGYLVELVTNGSLLPLYSDDLLDSFIAIKISNYHQRNAAVINQYRERPNVQVINSLDMWRDPELETDISLTEEESKVAYKRCPMGTIKVCNWKIWDCCAAEPLERHRGLPLTHVALSKDWLEELDRTSRATTCRHCYFGADTVKNLRELGEYDQEVQCIPS